MPLKRLMCQRADRLSDAARLTGAVNTVLCEDGALIGHNTDGYGFMQSVREKGYDLRGQEMTLLGSGGAASAVVAQAALDGLSHIHIFSRPDSASTQCLKEEALRIREVSPCQISFYDLTNLSRMRECIGQSQVLVNASSVGMAPRTDACLIPDASFFRPDLLVADVIYNPRETHLLAMAGECGCDTLNGLPMLLHQGAKAFEIWTGQKMPLEHIRKLLFS